MPKARQKYAYSGTAGMENLTEGQAAGMLGQGFLVPHPALQFPRMPPGFAHPMFRVYENSAKENLSRHAGSSQRLQGFQQAYRQHAAGLLAMGSMVVPPGHPLYGRDGSVAALYSERDRLQRENAELRKKLDEKSSKKD